MHQRPDWTYLLANAGYKTVITPASHLYFDHPEEPDTNERGYYWATRFTDMERTRDYPTVVTDLFTDIVQILLSMREIVVNP